MASTIRVHAPWHMRNAPPTCNLMPMNCTSCVDLPALSQCERVWECVHCKTKVIVTASEEGENCHDSAGCSKRARSSANRH